MQHAAWDCFRTRDLSLCLCVLIVLWINKCKTPLKDKTSVLFQQVIQPDLHSESPQDDGAEDGISEYAVEDVPLAVDLASVDLVKKLHEDEGVEDDGVVFWGGRVERSVAAAVDVKHALAWGAKSREGRANERV